MSLTRTAVLPASRLNARRFILARLNSDIRSPAGVARSTMSSTIPRPNGKEWIKMAIVGGVVAGSVLSAAAYGWYHVSGTKATIEKAGSILGSLKAAQKQVGKDKPSHIVEMLRPVCKAYVSYIPGGAYAVDKAFALVVSSGIASAIDAHAQEANVFIAKSITDIIQVIQDNRDGENTISAGRLIASITSRLFTELKALAGNAVSIGDQFELERRLSDLRSAAGVTGQTIATKAAEASQTLGRLSEQYELDKRASELKSTSAWIANTIVEKAPDVGREIQTAAGKAKDFVQGPVASSASSISEKVASWIYPRSDK